MAKKPADVQKEEKIKLNAAQREAVEFFDGPLAVLAGPGTGKTRVIVKRIAHQIREGLVTADRVVAMTFTVKAAEELRGRLREEVGASAAEMVTATTIHGFGLKIMQRFGDMIGLPPGMELLDPTRRRHMLKEIILSKGLLPSMRAGGLDGAVERVTKTAAMLANSGVLPEEAERAGVAWEKNLAEVMGSGTLDAEGEELARAAVEECALYRDAVRAWKQSCEEGWSRGLFTFDDLLLVPIQILRKAKGAAEIVRSECKSVIVDEFQDCNTGQIVLLRELMGPEAKRGGRAHVCVVGDDDQSIYGFRGADDRAFERFASIWAGARVVKLEENYRSRPGIVALANDTIARASSRFAPDKVVRATSKDPAVVETVAYGHNKYDLGVEAVATMMLTDRAEREKSGESVSWNDVAVIGRGHGDLERMATIFRMEGIPFRQVTKRSFADDSGVQLVMAWARWLIDRDDVASSCEVLSRAPANVPREQLLEWRRAFAAANSRVESDARTGWFASLERIDDERLGRVMARYGVLREKVRSLVAQDALMEIMSAVDPAHCDLLPAKERAERVKALVALLNTVRTLQPRLGSPGSLGVFLEYFDDMLSHDELKELGSLEDSVDRGNKDGDIDGGEEGAWLLTAHSAKGLEFDTVYVVRIDQHGFNKVKVDPEPALPPGIDPLREGTDRKQRVSDEARRLFYVSVTRAKRRLVLVGHMPKKPSGSVHFLWESVKERSGAIDAVDRAAEEVLEGGAPLGIGPLGRGRLGVSGDREQAAALMKMRDEAVSRARASAAEALEVLREVEVTEGAFEASMRALAEAAAVVAGASAAARRADVPRVVAAGMGRHSEQIGKIRRAAEARNAAEMTVRDPVVLPPVKPPLALSYTHIEEYLLCPRCYCMKFVLSLREPSRDEVTTGDLVHRAIERYHEAVRQAEEVGPLALEQARSVAAIRRIAETMLRARTPEGQVLSQELREQIGALVENAARMDQSTEHIGFDVERMIQFDYPVDGVTHRMTAKIDRIVTTPSGGYRLIDYKTGNATKKLLEPNADDLQMGIYRMALEHYEGFTPEAGGVAEYWCLSVGKIGVLPFDAMKLEKVRKKIDEVVRGILAGRFEQGKDCRGGCEMLEVMGLRSTERVAETDEP